MQRSVTVRLGEETLAFYEAVNRADQPVVGQAVFNVTPFKVGPYFVKIAVLLLRRADACSRASGSRCRCRSTSIRRCSTTRDAREVRQITLSYTFFIDRRGDGRAARGGGRGSTQLSASGEIRRRDSWRAPRSPTATHAMRPRARQAQPPYHLVDPSPWPLVGSMSALLLTGGGVMWMHEHAWPLGRCCWASSACSTPCSAGGATCCSESAHGRPHRRGVQGPARSAWRLFITSEVLFFFAFFWAFFWGALTRR